MLILVFLILQIACLANPVFTIDAAAKTFQLLCNAIDIVFTHFRDLLEAVYAEFI